MGRYADLPMDFADATLALVEAADVRTAWQATAVSAKPASTTVSEISSEIISAVPGSSSGGSW